MQPLSRREFLQDSAILAALASAGLTGSASAETQQAKETEPKKGHDKLRIAVIGARGTRGRGYEHVQKLAGRSDALVVTICDVDEAVVGPSMKLVQERQGKAPHYVQDLRKVLDDKEIDAVSIATPNHWHALAAIWAMQAGKDVYVEKPVSHNVSEGRRIVETARKYKKICQTGTQSRSSTGMREAIAYLHSGKLGKITLARGLCYKLRNSIGKVSEPTPVPKSVNFELWCGPAPVKPVMRENLHYDWHWVWDYGNGDLGNQGIHEMDKARWGLNKNTMPRSVFSLGGRYGYLDDGQTANTQMIVFDYGDCELIFEVRGRPSDSPFPKGSGEAKKSVNFVGNIWYGTEGMLVCPSYTQGVVLDPKGKLVQQFNGPEDHFGNFIKAVRSRRVEELNADILEGHLSSALCHLGNISYRLGTVQPFEKRVEALTSDKEAQATLERMIEHLKFNNVDVANAGCRVGRKLQIDPSKERFVGDSEADLMLTREYRKGFEVPQKV